MRGALLALLPLSLAACHPGSGAAGEAGEVPGEEGIIQPFAGIGDEEALRFAGTEPFWGGEVSGGRLTYTTPEDQTGQQIAVNRFAGRNGLSFSGELTSERFDMSVSQAPCSDGMSDRTYPFSVTLVIGAETRSGCAWSTRNPFKGGEGG